MTLEQLRIFVAVAERQHMTAAAQSLNLAQSAVSAAIATLESRHDVKLFHRVGRGIALTEAGRLFLGEAKAVLARAEAAEQSLDDLTGLKRGTLRVEASQTIGGYWLPRRLADFHKDYPGIRVALSIGNTAQVAAAVYEGRADIGFVEGDVDDPLLAVERVAGDRLVLVVGANHLWATKRKILPGDLMHTEWVLREKGSGTRAMFEQALAKLGVDMDMLKVALEFPSNEAVRGTVAAGLGATVLSASVVAAAIEAGLLRHLKFDLPERAFFAVTHKDRYLAKSAAELLARVRGASPEPKIKARR